MRRGEFNLYFMILALVGFGAAALYVGFFGGSTVCDPTCRPHAPGTVEPMFTFGGGLFLLIGLYMLYRALHRRAPDLLVSGVAYGDEGLGEQARLAQEMRAYYTNPAHRLGKLANPTEFDRMMLGLFDSIEADGADIDVKIDGLHSYLKQRGFLRSYGDRFKANIVWRRGASSLQWVRPSPELWQLRCNWNRLLRVANVGPGWEDGQTVAPKWISIARRDVGVVQPT